MAKKKLVALVPIKAHSERVKAKNFRLFNGKPLFHWILETLLSIKEIDTVVINTDAQTLLKEHEIWNDDRILIRDRKTHLLGDFTNINLILKDDMDAVPSSVYLMTHTTNPLLRKNTIEEALKKFEVAKKKNMADSLFAVNKFQTRFYKADGTPINHNPKELLRTQDLEPWYEENSNLYLYTLESFMKTNARIGQKPLLYTTPRLDSVDIDDVESWRVAEAISVSRERESK